MSMCVLNIKIQCSYLEWLLRVIQVQVQVQVQAGDCDKNFSTFSLIHISFTRNLVYPAHAEF